MGDTLTTRDAYAAMFTFLEEIYRRTGSDDLGALLGGMSLLEDGGTADPARWTDWQAAIREVKERNVNLDFYLGDRTGS
jgi:hypothetical protein